MNAGAALRNAAAVAAVLVFFALLGLAWAARPGPAARGSHIVDGVRRAVVAPAEPAAAHSSVQCPSRRARPTPFSAKL